MISQQFEVFNRYENQFWSGYFTTDPHIKKQIRDFEEYLHLYQTLFSLSSFDLDNSEHLGRDEVLQETACIMQHHDAITGTHRQECGEDYRFRMQTIKAKTSRKILNHV